MRAFGLGHSWRGATRRRRASPKFAITRAAAPMFSPSCGSTRTTIGPASSTQSLVLSVPAPGMTSCGMAGVSRSPLPAGERGTGGLGNPLRMHHVFDMNPLQANIPTNLEPVGDFGLVINQAHTDARRLVLGAAVGMSVAQVRIFIESLRQTGYTVAIVMLIGLTDRRLATYLAAHGAEPRRMWFVRRLHGPIHAYRFELFTRYLRQYGGRYDEILISDVRDVAFQAHPFAGMQSADCHFFLEGAAKTIGSEPTNALYMRLFLASAEFDAIAAQRITCCGVLLGGTRAVSAYLERMSARLRRVPLRVRRKIGADTAFQDRKSVV